MVPTALGSVSLGYKLLWNRQRQICGVQLFVGTHDKTPTDVPHLLSAIGEFWSEQAPTLLLSAQSPHLLTDLLDHAPAKGPWIEVHESHLQDPALCERVHQAHRRGLQLIWRGEPGARPSADMAPAFLRAVMPLTAGEALAGLQLSLRKHNGANTQTTSPLSSPVLADQIYEDLTSWVLAEHCLDEQAAWGLAGWPAEDVLHGYRHQRIQPGQRAISRLTQAIDADESVELVERILSEEPILAYRFLRFANSAGLGLPCDINSLRHALMVLGLSQLRSWLLTQMAHASGDLNLQPVRDGMVMRARLMAQLLDAGEGRELRREVYLCGLLSQIDLLMGEPLSATLARVPLSDRITGAILSQTGPYQPFLEIAAALESPDTQSTRMLCSAHQMDLELVNGALLRTLAHAKPHPAKGLLLV
jgi:hypothetical protein